MAKHELYWDEGNGRVVKENDDEYYAPIIKGRDTVITIETYEVYEHGVGARMDAYNNMVIDKDEAYKTLDEIYNRLDDRTFSEKESLEEGKNGLVKVYILSYKTAITSGNGLFEAADKLRETLNK